MRTPDKAIDRPAITVVSGEIREHARGSRDERVSVETVSAKPSEQKTEQRGKKEQPWSFCVQRTISSIRE